MDPKLSLKFDLNNEELLPITLFFDAISRTDFVRYAGFLLRGTSVGVDYQHCQFYDPNDLEDEPFEGVRFRLSMTDEEIVISHEDFIRYLKMAAVCHIRRQPIDKFKLIALFKEHSVSLLE